MDVGGNITYSLFK
jgi:hypothetical protein